MKGVPGLIVALSLGLAGALCNWWYMARQVRDLDLIRFIAVGEGGVKAGDTLTAGHFVAVPLPRAVAERLVESAPKYDDLPTVVGMTAFRDFREGEILLHQDLRTPPGNDLKRDLGPEEQVIWVAVDARGFVPQFLSGGDEISFIVPRLGTAGPTEAGSPAGARTPSTTELIGPFHVLALGTRRGASERARAAGYSSGQENVLAIRVKRVNETQLEPKAHELLDRLRLANNQALGIVLHGEQKRD